MARYIDADALLEELQEELGFESLLYTKEQNEWFDKGLKCAVRDVKHQPTADVVEVVRCKDCIHGRKINNAMSPEKFFKEDCVVCECKDTIGDEPMIYPPTHYCSYGERRKKDE